MAIRKQTEEIRSFITKNVKRHPKDIGKVTADHFKISRSAVSNHLKALIADDILSAEGSTKARTYSLRNFVDEYFPLAVSPELREDRVWRENISPLLRDVKENVRGICHYGFTEMLNNVIDHSESKNAVAFLSRNAVNIEIAIWDTGVGIFNKIQSSFGLDEPRKQPLCLRP